MKFQQVLQSEKLRHRADFIKLFKIVDDVYQYYSGNINQLNSAIGLLFSGYYFGWRFLHLVHNKRTIRKYEQVLDIKIKEFFKETGCYSYRSAGLNEVANHPNFWKCVSGDISIKDRKEIHSEEEIMLLALIEARDNFKTSRSA